MEEANPGIVPGGAHKRSSTAKRKRTSPDGSAEKDAQIPLDPAGPSETDKRGQQESETFPQDMASYAYLFPDLEAFASLPKSRVNGESGTTNFYQNPTTFAQPTGTDYPENAFAAPGNHGMPASGYQQLSPGPMAAAPFPQSNFSGFGLTVPAATTPLSSLTSKSPTSQFDSNAYSTENPTPSPVKSKENVPQVLPVVSSVQSHLREAVEHSLDTDMPSTGILSGVIITADELERRKALQNELGKSLADVGTADNKTDAHQVSENHIGKLLRIDG